MRTRIVLGAVVAMLGGLLAPASSIEAVLDPTGTGVDPAGPRARYEAQLIEELAPGDEVPPLLGYAWTGRPGRVAGADVVRNGEFIVDDTPLDDTGADAIPDNGGGGLWLVPDTRGTCGTGGGFRHGEYTYPADEKYGANAADLVEARFTSRDGFRARFRFQTLIDASTTAVRLTIDGGELLVAGDGPVGAKATLDGTPIDAAVDMANNVFEVRVPTGVADLGPGPWTVTLEVGVSDGTKPDPVTDLAFVADEVAAGEMNCWRDKQQSALITAGTPPARTVSVSSDRDLEPLHGPYVFLYEPWLDLGEGITGQPKYGAPASNKIYAGSLQPYGVVVPDELPTLDAPLLVLPHCLNCNHNTYLMGAWPGLESLAESLGAIIVTPLAYGEGGHYEEEAEWDVFNVLADVRTRFHIDPNRIYLGGMSMGSLATFRLGGLYPDLWAGHLGVGVYTNPNCVSPIQGDNSPCGIAPFNYFDLLPNVTNSPFVIVNGGLDKLTPVTGAREIADRLAELDAPHRYIEFPTRAHEVSLTGETHDLVSPVLAGQRRVAIPGRFTYVIDRTIANPEWGLTYDRAWYLRDLELGPEGQFGRVEATNGRGETWETTPYTGSGSHPAGNYTARGLDRGSRSTGTTDALTLELTNLVRANVNTVSAGFVHGPWELTVTTDTEAVVLVDGVDVRGSAFPVGTTTMTVAGSVSGTDWVGTDVDSPDGGSLPATGHRTLIGLGVLLAAAGLAVLRRGAVRNSPA